MPPSLNITILGLSLTSSWGNGHATIYRALCKALVRRGHHVTFLEHDKPWYANNRDLPSPPEDLYGRVHLYSSLDELDAIHRSTVSESDMVIVGSYVPQGIAVGEWVQRLCPAVTAFYDIDTPITLAALARNECDYLSPDLVPRYRLYFSFTGGPTLNLIEREYGSPSAQPLYCCVDPEHYFPEHIAYRYDLGYMGTYSADRQPTVERLLLHTARHWPEGRFVIAGPGYPQDTDLTANVKHIDHLPPGQHRSFYNQQRFTLNVTRADMRAAGYAPSVRLFEAAACGTPIISDDWPGLDTFFTPGEQILTASGSPEVISMVQQIPDAERQRIGLAAREQCLRYHTANHRALELEHHHSTPPLPLSDNTGKPL